jgi:hypothetical protein
MLRSTSSFPSAASRSVLLRRSFATNAYVTCLPPQLLPPSLVELNI